MLIDKQISPKNKTVQLININIQNNIRILNHRNKLQNKRKIHDNV